MSPPIENGEDNLIEQAARCGVCGKPLLWNCRLAEYEECCEHSFGMTREEGTILRLLLVLRDLRRGTRTSLGSPSKTVSCWCEHAIGNPMFHDHSEPCLRAQWLWDSLAPEYEEELR